MNVKEWLDKEHKAALTILLSVIFVFSCVGFSGCLIALEKRLNHRPDFSQGECRDIAAKPYDRMNIRWYKCPHERHKMDPTGELIFCYCEDSERFEEEYTFGD